MDFLKRELAPLVGRGWEEIDAEATRVLQNTLVARRLVDVSGPHGFDFSAVNLGHVAVAENHVQDGVRFGVRQVLPLVELRVPFDIGVWALDDLERGAKGIDLGPVVQAALRLASFEDRAIFRGFAGAQIAGMEQASALPALPLGSDMNSVLDALTSARLALRDAGVSGPYAAVLSAAPYRVLASSGGAGVSPLQRAEELLGGPVHESNSVNGGLVVSTRGGDFELTLGQDAAVGYEWHDKGTVRLFLTESFTFRVLTPEAIVKLTP
jgi:uncharacterized linocin/CFP29 family protein